MTDPALPGGVVGRPPWLTRNNCGVLIHDSRTHLLSMLAKAGVALGEVTSSDVQVLVDVVRRFATIPVDDGAPVEDDGDGMLAQFGSFNFRGTSELVVMGDCRATRRAWVVNPLSSDATRYARRNRRAGGAVPARRAGDAKCGRILRLAPAIERRPAQLRDEDVCRALRRAVNGSGSDVGRGLVAPQPGGLGLRQSRYAGCLGCENVDLGEVDRV
jgi:hypothetical protein